MSINKLVTVLRELKDGKGLSEIKEEIISILTEIELKELYFAEHQMVEAGIPPEDIKVLCNVQVRKAGNKIEQLKEKLSAGHVLHTLISEHERQFALLDKLREVNYRLQGKHGYPEAKSDFEEMLDIFETLNQMELHELREENVLFPQLDSRGIFGHPYIMKIEHQAIIDYRQELQLLTSTAAERDFEPLKKRINTLVKFLILKLSDHMAEENNVIYPMAFEIIEDEAAWDDMKRACDRIGYGNFSNVC
jgi:DUF438 domain-containing protein